MASYDYQYLAHLVRRAQAGSSDAFAELYVATYQQQYAFSYRYLQDEFLAQDAIQETYILALKNITTLCDPLVFVSWLNQINMRVCFAMYQKERKHNAELDRYEQSQLDHSKNRGENESPEFLVMKKDEQEYVINQILALPFSESQAIFLRYYRNMKVGDIARMMDISQSSVKRYLTNGRKMLAQRLGKENFQFFGIGLEISGYPVIYCVTEKPVNSWNPGIQIPRIRKKGGVNKWADFLQRRSRN